MTTPRVFPRPQAVGRFVRPGGHTLAYQALGSLEGPVWLVLHGGPGGRGNPGLLAPFNLSRQGVVMPDQRGCGHSRPSGALRGNHLPQLVDDLEALRQHLNVAQWSILGGSWGATLAVAYAARHPAAVQQLVLRGAFDASDRTTRRLLQRFWPAHTLRRAHMPTRAVWHRLSQLLQSGTPGVTPCVRQWAAMELHAAEHGARRALWHARMDPAARAHWRQLHCQRRRLPHLRGPRAVRFLHEGWHKYRIQAHHLARGCSLRPGDWTRLLDTLIRHQIPCTWVHGVHDAVCAPAISRQAQARQQQQGHLHSQRLQPLGGHLPTDPAIVRALRVVVSGASPVSEP